MERVQTNGQWSLFCPNEAPGLADCWGADFESLYTKYENEGKAKKVVTAQNLWFEVLTSQIETGTSYMLFKSVAIESHPSRLVGSSESKNRYFDFDKLAEGTALVTENLNKIIDINDYPVETARTSNLRHRLIGIGVQGLADTFILLGMPFDSSDAQQLNKDIFENIYYHALESFF